MMIPGAIGAGLIRMGEGLIGVGLIRIGVSTGDVSGETADKAADPSTDDASVTVAGVATTVEAGDN